MRLYFIYISSIFHLYFEREMREREYRESPSPVIYRYSSQDTHGDQCSFGMHSLGCSSTHLLLKLLLIYGSVFVSSSLRLPPSSLEAIIWGNISPLSPPMQRSAVKTEAHNRLIHSTWRYFAGGGTSLVYGQ